VTDQEYQALRLRTTEQVGALSRLADDLYAAYEEDFRTRASDRYRVKLWSSYRHIRNAVRSALKAV
jgi:hypothetical protein